MIAARSGVCRYGVFLNRIMPIIALEPDIYLKVARDGNSIKTRIISNRRLKFITVSKKS
jgi:hypothetical protein